MIERIYGRTSTACLAFYYLPIYLLWILSPFFVAQYVSDHWSHWPVTGSVLGYVLGFILVGWAILYPLFVIQRRRMMSESRELFTLNSFIWSDPLKNPHLTPAGHRDTVLYMLFLTGVSVIMAFATAKDPKAYPGAPYFILHCIYASGLIVSFIIFSRQARRETAVIQEKKAGS